MTKNAIVAIQQDKGLNRWIRNDSKIKSNVYLINIA